MIKYQLNITLYEKISLYSIRFDISLSQACCPGNALQSYRNAQWKNVLYYYKHFLKILGKLVKK